MSDPHSQHSRISALISPFVLLSENWISRVGIFLVTASGIFWLMVLPTYLQGSTSNAYLGILIFLVFPALFFAGLGLIPLGMWLVRRRRTAGGVAPSYPRLDFRSPETRRLGAFLALATLANVVIGTQFTYRAVAYMDSSQFCGQACHSVMNPEFSAYQHSAHARVECVSCHIGPGANWFVKSKLDGVRQVVAVMTNSYHRPIQTPIRELRPARDTCEVCHWPEKFGGNRLRVLTKYDDGGQPQQTVLLMRIGGGRNGSSKGIHGAHVGPGVSIRYAQADPSREKIPWVEYSLNGKTTEFLANGTSRDAAMKMPMREMDCMDCHNRPSHTYEMPERAVDSALANGEIDVTIPGIRKTVLDSIQGSYASSADASGAVVQAIEKSYRDGQPAVWQARGADVTRSARAAAAIYGRNVFPEMNVKWGSYPNHIGHTDTPGCFRCHDGDHVSKSGEAVTQDCNTCHAMLAVDEKSPKVLADLGVNTDLPSAKPAAAGAGGIH